LVPDYIEVWVSAMLLSPVELVQIWALLERLYTAE